MADSMPAPAEVQAPAPAAYEGRETPPGSLVSPFVRHLAILVLTAAGTFVLATSVSARDQPMTWLLAALAAGVVAALIGRGWLTLPFLLSGLFIGLVLELGARHGTTEQAAQVLTLNWMLYLGLAVAAALAPVAVLIVLNARR